MKITGGINKILFANRSLWENTMSSLGNTDYKNLTSSSENQWAILDRIDLSSSENRLEQTFSLTYYKKSEFSCKCFSNKGVLSFI